MALNVNDLAIELRLLADPQDQLPTAQQRVLTRLLSVATSIVQRYAPDAPPDVCDEAEVRIAGYLYDRPPEAATRGTSALLHSGAQSLLAPWRNPGLPEPEEDDA